MTPKCATLGDDVARVLYAIAGAYEPTWEREQGGLPARLEHDGYWGELGHAIKNVFVEQLRRWSWKTGWAWLNRGNKPEAECTYYEFPN